MARRGVRAVILDEAQHLLKLGSGSSGGKLLDQLDWLKSMTNVTGVLHILIGTYELLNFRNLSGQASRRGLDIHFPRYLFQHEQDRQDFQGILLALLKQVPLSTDIPALMQHWFYFYERSLGCVGVLKDWLIRAVAAALHDGGDTLTLARVEEHALTLSQCERMALESIEGEQKLGYSESRREQLWRLLQAGMDSTGVPAPIVPTVAESQSQETAPDAPSPDKTSRRKRSSASKPKTATKEVEVLTEPAPKKRQAQKKSKKPAEPRQETSPDADSQVSKSPSPENPPEEPTPSRKKPARRVGQRQPKRDPVG